MAQVEINDIRPAKDFRGISFSKFKKSDVRKELLNSIMKLKIEPACYWSAELICAGHFYDLWEALLHFFFKHVHLGNPKIALYLDMRIKNFKELINGGFNESEIRLRNSDKIRKLFGEVICILCDAKRMHSLDNMKIKKTEFDMTQMLDQFKAPGVHYAEDVFCKGDPKEVFVALNELAYNLSDERKNNLTACYWIEWILEFETICKQQKQKITCERRSFAPVDSKSQMDIVWLIWDLFLKKADEQSGQIYKKIVNASLNLFSLKYSSGCGKKRKYILYFVVSLFCEKINFDEEIMRESQKPFIANVLKNIDFVYKQIKKNEESPGTEYLFRDLSANNLEKTIEKLDALNSFGESFIPRI